MATFSSVTCSEVHNTRKENWNIRDGVKCSVQLDVAYNVRHSLILDLLTWPRFWPYTPSGVAKPAATSCDLVDLPTDYTQDSQGMYYTNSRVTVGYEQTREEEPTEPTDRKLFDENLRSTPEYIMARGARLYFENDPSFTSLDGVEIPAVMRSTYVLERTIYGMTTIPTSLLTLQDKINDADYTSSILGLTFPKGTLLFSPSNISRSIAFPSGSDGFNVSIAYLFKEGGWNKFVDPNDVQFRLQTLKVKNGPPNPAVDADFTPFQEADFSAWLF